MKRKADCYDVELIRSKRKLFSRTLDPKATFSSRCLPEHSLRYIQSDNTPRHGRECLRGLTCSAANVERQRSFSEIRCERRQARKHDRVKVGTCFVVTRSCNIFQEEILDHQLVRRTS